jgi:MFS transporter, putative metabolite:H+ symporter
VTKLILVFLHYLLLLLYIYPKFPFQKYSTMFYLLNATKTAKNYGTQPPPNSQEDQNDEKDLLLQPISVKEVDTENSGDDHYLLNIDEALQRLGMGLFQYRIMIATGLILAADSCEVVILSFLNHVAQNRQQWQQQQHQQLEDESYPKFLQDDIYGQDTTTDGGDALSAMVLPGALLGALWWGVWGDLVGRRSIFLAISAVVSIFGVATSFATTFQWLVATRLLVSFGIGGLTVPFNACAELMPPSARGKQLVLIQIFRTVGALAVHLMLQQQKQDTIADSTKSLWRLIAGLCAIPSVLATILAWIFVPESPRWLVARGNQDSAVAILRHAAQINGKDPYETFPQGIILYSHEPEEVSCSLSQVMTLFSSGWMSITSALAATYFGKAFLDHGTVSMAVTVFSNDERQQEYQAWFIASSEFLSLILVYHLIDRWGRATTQCLPYATGGLLCLTLALLVDEDPSINPNGPLVMVFMAHLFINSATTVTWIATSEVLSTAIRTTGHGTSHAVAVIGGAFSTYVLARIYSVPTVGLILFVTGIWTASASTKLPETNVKEMGVVHYPTHRRNGTHKPRRNHHHHHQSEPLLQPEIRHQQQQYHEVI